MSINKRAETFADEQMRLKKSSRKTTGLPVIQPSIGSARAAAGGKLPGDKWTNALRRR